MAKKRFFMTWKEFEKAYKSITENQFINRSGLNPPYGISLEGELMPDEPRRIWVDLKYNAICQKEEELNLPIYKNYGYEWVEFKEVIKNT